MLALGLKKGDRVGIYAPNMAEWTLVQYAASRADLVLVNVNPSFTEPELEYCINKVGIKTLVMAERFKKSNYVKIVKNVIGDYYEGREIKNEHFPTLKNVVVIEDHVKDKTFYNLKDLYNLSTQKEAQQLTEIEANIDFDAPTNIQFTSGTTGYPKGATLTHHNILNNAYFLTEVLKYDA